MALAVEDLYFGRNAHSAFAVGQARGVVLLSAGMAGVPCFSYTPQAVKQAVCGTGSAEKGQVQRMVGALLSLAEPPQPDHAADALAVAICHATARRSRRPWDDNRRDTDVIASIRGEVISRLGGEVVIEAAGVGYRMAVSTETLTSVPAAGEQARLFTHLVLRDDGMHLFGFATQPERELFLMLIGVQSVGPKVALAVLSGGTPRELLNAIASGDSARFQAVPGIGSARPSDHRRAAREGGREGHRRDRGAPHALGRPAHAGPRGTARPGLHVQEADSLLEKAGGETAEDLIAGALRGAR